MFAKLDEMEKRFEELETRLSSAEIIASTEIWRNYLREHSRISEIVQVYREYKKAASERLQAEEMLAEDCDKEMAQYIKEEHQGLTKQIENLEKQLKVLLVPRDPDDDKSVIMEIRAGTGGEEAALFAADLLRMYSRYAEQRGWKIEIMDISPTDIGGIKEVVFAVEGKGVYNRLKYESGVHRVQRVPATESGGRIHTSASTVAVLPEAEEIEVEIRSQDLRVDTFCSTGPGGQSVNTTQSAVRITHIPTGVVAVCQDEKSQLKNKDKAMRVLRSRLFNKYKEEQESQMAKTRKSQVGSGDRSERIRTYNFPQNRVTEHRIGLNLHKLEFIIDGALDDLIEPLITHFQTEEMLKAGD